MTTNKDFRSICTRCGKKALLAQGICFDCGWKSLDRLNQNPQFRRMVQAHKDENQFKLAEAEEQWELNFGDYTRR